MHRINYKLSQLSQLTHRNKWIDFFNNHYDDFMSWPFVSYDVGHALILMLRNYHHVPTITDDVISGLIEAISCSHVRDADNKIIKWLIDQQDKPSYDISHVANKICNKILQMKDLYLLAYFLSKIQIIHDSSNAYIPHNVYVLYQQNKNVYSSSEKEFIASTIEGYLSQHSGYDANRKKYSNDKKQNFLDIHKNVILSKYYVVVDCSECDEILYDGELCLKVEIQPNFKNSTVVLMYCGEYETMILNGVENIGNGYIVNNNLCEKIYIQSADDNILSFDDQNVLRSVARNVYRMCTPQDYLHTDLHFPSIFRLNEHGMNISLLHYEDNSFDEYTTQNHIILFTNGMLDMSYFDQTDNIHRYNHTSLQCKNMCFGWAVEHIRYWLRTEYNTPRISFIDKVIRISEKFDNEHGFSNASARLASYKYAQYVQNVRNHYTSHNSVETCIKYMQQKYNATTEFPIAFCINCGPHTISFVMHKYFCELSDSIGLIIRYCDFQNSIQTLRSRIVAATDYHKNGALINISIIDGHLLLKDLGINNYCKNINIPELIKDNIYKMYYYDRGFYSHIQCQSHFMINGLKKYIPSIQSANNNIKTINNIISNMYSYGFNKNVILHTLLHIAMQAVIMNHDSNLIKNVLEVIKSQNLKLDIAYNFAFIWDILLLEKDYDNVCLFKEVIIPCDYSLTDNQLEVLNNATLALEGEAHEHSI
jgi:hypothetical protein